MAATPMFPLGTVLLPGVALPLQIFEPRYRKLLEDCLAGDGTFGVVLIERGSEIGGGDTRFGVGTLARIVDHRELAGGRHALVAVGTERIRVDAWLDDDPYPRAEITVWPDGIDLPDTTTPADASDPTPPTNHSGESDATSPTDRSGESDATSPADASDATPPTNHSGESGAEAPSVGPDGPAIGAPGDTSATRYARVTGSVRRLLATAAELGQPVPPATFDAPDDPTAGSYVLAALAPLGPLDRQRLLEVPGPAARLDLLDELVDDQLALLRLGSRTSHDPGHPGEPDIPSEPDDP